MLIKSINRNVTSSDQLISLTVIQIDIELVVNRLRNLALD